MRSSGMKTYIGIDNGTTGTMAILCPDGTKIFLKVPVRKEQDYTKAKKNVTRVDVRLFYELLKDFKDKDVFALIERPMVNPTRFQSSASALRCMEAELTVIEALDIPYQFCDSKEWQKELLPKGCDDTKKASLDIGNRLFPMFREVKHPDRDGLLIAEYARRKQL